VKQRGSRSAILTAVLISSACIPARAAHAAEEPAAAAPAPDEQSQRMLDRIQALEEQTQTHQSDLDRLKRFKFSGYVQVRYETAENATDTVRVLGVPATVTPAADQRIYVRRGRFKLTYDASPLSQAVLYFDGNTAGSNRNITLLEAYVTLMDPWTPLHSHQLTFGQMNVPFGYELERSSSLRELPERSRAENVLFPGERDRGAKLVDQWTPKLETVLGVWNGYGINDVNFPTLDPTAAKDWTARVRWSEGWLDVAGSVYEGHTTIPLTGADVEVDKTRQGGDAQFYYEMPRAGGGSLRGEFYRGASLNADSSRVLIAPPSAGNPVSMLRPGADPRHLATDFVGWYAMWVQNFGERWQIAARYDVYDPNTELDHDQFARTSVGLNWFFDGYTRITAAYDAVKTDALSGGASTDPADNLWTFQVQHKF
jgi:hypothetical protein